MIENQIDDIAQDSLVQFVEVLIPVRIPLTYTYRVPESLKGSIVRGSRVIVQFGRKRIITAVVVNVHHTPPKVYEAKPVLEVLDTEALINAYQFELIKFLANYYLCTEGEVLNAAMPAGFKLGSESKIQLNPEFELDASKLSDTELKVIQALESSSLLSYDGLAEIVSVKSTNLLVKSLLEKGAILLFEEVKERYTPKIIKKIRLLSHWLEDTALKELFGQLEKKSAQLEILQKYLHLTQVHQRPQANQLGLDKAKLMEGLSASPMNTLVKNTVFEEFAVIVPRFELHEHIDYHQTLSPPQQAAITKIEDFFKEKDVVLLHGVTGSGKTEIYIDLIQKALGGQSQVLFMVPEIALTTQLVMRLQKVFGKKLGVYHSKFSDNERVEVWTGLTSGRLSIVVGVRSSVFLPFDNLGLIIIDEEHDASYKQNEPAPRYHGRDAALVLARSHHAKVLLGSATPSVETYFKASQGQWGLVSMLERYGGAVMPQIETIDLKYARKNKLMRNDFSLPLLTALEEGVKKHHQSIIFQNRRGYAPILICEECGYIPQCEHCAVSLTYHMYKNSLTCHYCGYKEEVIKTCPACGSTKIKTQGAGTEKLEDDLKLLVPEARIQRMDLETTRSKNSFQKIVEDVEKGEIDILVGTQMVTKGFDFGRVSLVGIVDFDRMLYFPDFRSAEKTFQVATQVAGRAGRREQQGLVMIQTSNPAHGLLGHIRAHDYLSFFNAELAERKKFNYPPFSRTIKVTIKNTQEFRAQKTAEYLQEILVGALGNSRILGPQAPVINRIRNYFLFDIFIKLERSGIDLFKAKSFIQNTIQQTLVTKPYQSSIVIIDVDPI